MANTLMDMIHSGNQHQQDSSALPTSLDDPRMAKAKQMVSSNGGNVQEAFAKTQEYINAHNGNGYEAFLSLCKEKMTNPETFINMLAGRM